MDSVEAKELPRGEHGGIFYGRPCGTTFSKTLGR